MQTFRIVLQLARNFSIIAASFSIIILINSLHNPEETVPTIFEPLVSAARDYTVSERTPWVQIYGSFPQDHTG